MRFYLVIFLLLINSISFSQINYYHDYIKMAESFVLEDQCKEAILVYKKAFERQKGTDIHYYNCAKLYGQFQDEQAIYFLKESILAGNRDLSEIVNEPSFYFLKETEKWKTLIEKLKFLIEYDEKSLNIVLKSKLENIYEIDQRRKQIKSKKEWSEMERLDGKNFFEVKSIIDKYGFPGKSLVGEKGNIAACLVIIHYKSLPAKQKILPLLKDSVEKGETPAKYYALLVDRILVEQAMPTLYGTTSRIDNDNFIIEVFSKKNVNVLREEVGLAPIDAFRVYE